MNAPITARLGVAESWLRRRRPERHRGPVMNAEIHDTFVHPCLECGRTVRVVSGAEQPHDHQAFGPDESLAAYAWWEGWDSAKRDGNSS